jgi:nucleoid DNA-binding protein
MLKSELVEALAIKIGVPIKDSERYLNTLTNIIYEELRKGKEVKISGFGTFSVSHRESRGGVNPRQPSQRIIIPKLNTPKFKAGEAFKSAVKI